jgi:hypothetical protein
VAMIKKLMMAFKNTPMAKSKKEGVPYTEK